MRNFLILTVLLLTVNAFGKVANYHQMLFRGTANSWTSTPMELVDNYTWQVCVTFANTGNESFKFDVHGDWSTNFGDNNGDGIADPSGNSIPASSGDYTITLNDQTKAYKIVKGCDTSEDLDDIDDQAESEPIASGNNSGGRGKSINEVSLSTKVYRRKSVKKKRSRPGKPKPVPAMGRIISGPPAHVPYFPPHQFEAKLDTSNESYESLPDPNFKSPLHNPLSTFSIDVDTASYANVRRFLNRDHLPPMDSVRIEEMVNYFTYNYPEPEGKHPFAVSTEYTECPWSSGHKLLQVGIQGKKIGKDRLPPSNLVFLIDVSGSMSSYNKLPLLKKGFKLLTKNLRDEDRVSMVVYAGAAGVVLPPTSGANKKAIMNAFDRLRAGGSTAGAAGINLAYKVAEQNLFKDGNNRIIIATDGDFNVGVSSDSALVKLIEQKRNKGIFLTVLGFGMGNYKDSKMEKLADKGNGNYAYIDNMLEAKKVLVKEMSGTLFTIAKDVKIQIEFNPAKVKAYRLIGYKNRRLKKEDFNDDRKDAGELGAGHTVTALYEIVPAGSKENLGVDTLKYQKTEIPKQAYHSSEVVTVKLRYKKPKGNVSTLLKTVVNENSFRPFAQSSNNIRFASAVTQFGMLLTKSQYQGTSSYLSTLKLAKSAKGKDDNGYRAEMIKLIEKAELLKK